MDHECAMNTTKLKAALADCQKMREVLAPGLIVEPWMRLVEALVEMAMQGAAEEATEEQFEGQPLTTEEEVNLRAWLETDRFGSASIPVVRRLLATLDAERAAKGILLPGWTCSCGCFNGSAKELRSTCRTCGAARTT